MANSTDTVAQLNRLAQHTRIRIGELDVKAPRLRDGDGWMLAGDQVITRRNDRTLRTDDIWGSRGRRFKSGQPDGGNPCAVWGSLD